MQSHKDAAVHTVPEMLPRMMICAGLHAGGSHEQDMELVPLARPHAAHHDELASGLGHPGCCFCCASGTLNQAGRQTQRRRRSHSQGTAGVSISLN